MKTFYKDLYTVIMVALFAALLVASVLTAQLIYAHNGWTVSNRLLS